MYSEDRTICYGEDDEMGIAVYVPKCSRCGRYVKADARVRPLREKDDNATCSKCGRTRMWFQGFFDPPGT